MKVRKIISCVVLLLALFGISVVAAGVKDMPRPRSFITDRAMLLSMTTRNKLEIFLHSVEKKTSAEIAVVTILSLDGDTVENYAVELFEKWGIGKEGKDNGILFLIAKNERKMRIEIGYGLEGALPDGRAGTILDTYVMPQFRAGNFSEGIMAGTIAIAEVVGQEYKVDLLSGQGINSADYLPIQPSQQSENVRKFFSFLFILAILSGRFFWPLFIGHMFMGRRYWSGGGHYRGGGSFSSGFGGFGGGFSGGGGASRGW